MGIGEFPQQAENRFRVTKALLAEEWFVKILVYFRLQIYNSQMEALERERRKDFKRQRCF